MYVGERSSLHRPLATALFIERLLSAAQMRTREWEAGWRSKEKCTSVASLCTRTCEGPFQAGRMSGCSPVALVPCSAGFEIPRDGTSSPRRGSPRGVTRPNPCSLSTILPELFPQYFSHSSCKGSTADKETRIARALQKRVGQGASSRIRKATSNVRGRDLHGLTERLERT